MIIQMQALSQYQTQRVVAFFFNDIRVTWCTVTPLKSIISHCNPDIHTRVSLSSVYVPAVFSPDWRSKSRFQRWCLLLHIPERKRRDYRRADGNLCLALTRHTKTTSSAQDNAPIFFLFFFFCLNSAEIMAEVKQRGQPRRPVESVWASLHDHPICQGPGVWLAFWWRSFSKDTDCLVDPGGTCLTDGDKKPLPSMMNATLCWMYNSSCFATI